MHWDDELERLAHTVVEYFGEDALSEASARAFSAAMQRRHRLPREFEQAGSDRLTAALGHGLSILAPGVFEDALRAELRRLVRPH